MRAKVPIAAALAVALTATALVAGDVSQLARKLRDGLRQQNEGAIATALAALIRTGGEDAAEEVYDLARKLPPGVAESAYWQLVNALGEFRDEAACAWIGEQVTRGRQSGLARDIMFAAQSNQSRAVIELHRVVLEDGPEDLQRMAADQLGNIRLVESVDALIDALEREEGERRSDLLEPIARSLTRLTGADCGPAAAWRGWWEPRRDKGLPERKESGRTGTVTDYVDPFDQKALESLDPKRILVLTCHCVPKKGGYNHDFDHIERLLGRMEVPNTVVRRTEFEKPDYKGLEEAWVLCVNCTMIEDHCVNPDHKPGPKSSMRMFECVGPGPHEIISHRLSPQAVERIKEFVERGGYLFTEDWGLYEVLEEAWPRFIGSYPKYPKKQDPRDPQPKVYLPEMKVEVVPGRGETSHPLMRGVWAPEPGSEGSASEGDGTVSREATPTPADLAGEHGWQVDEDSPAIVVHDRAAVRVPMVSPNLKDHEMAKGHDAVVATFFPAAVRPRRSGRPVTGHYLGEEKLRGGRVLHVLSHFGRQVSQDDEFALQRLLVNFLLEANQRVPSTPQGRRAAKLGGDEEGR